MDRTTMEPPDSGELANVESKAQEQARLRRERRNAKIAAGGSARLNKINAISGRPQAAAAGLERSSSQPVDIPATSVPHRVPDPEESDITNIYQRPSKDEAMLKEQEDLVRAMLRSQEKANESQDPQENGPNNNPGDDPMAQIMQQLQSMLNASAGTHGTGDQSVPPALQELFGATPSATKQEPETSTNYTWRVVHTLFALMLATYAVFSFSFNRSETDSLYNDVDKASSRLFWIFTTTELLLQSGRYLIDGGQLPGNSVLTMAGRILPEPWGNYVRIANRYSIIYTTLLSDAMILIFVLGIAAWWKGQAAS